MAVTRSGSSDDRAWVVPESKRPLFAQRYGPVYAGDEAERRIRALTNLSTCGDRVTADALALERPPFIGIVDFKTQRHEPIPAAKFAALAARRRVRVKNPAGMLTERLRSAVRGLVATDGGLIEVDGEEDLGALALVESLPAGATVIYGIPGEGVSFIAVDRASKDRVRALLDQMELRTVDLGD